MSEEQRLIYHWRLWATLGWRYCEANYHSSEFEQCLSKYYVMSGECS